MLGTHHALLYRSVSVTEAVLPAADGAAEVHDRFIEKFGIDDARSLIQSAYHRPLEATVQLLVIRSESVTLEAQNALLKVLEEPPKSTQFVFLLPPDVHLLPTLLSRFVEVNDSIDEVDSSDHFTVFLQADVATRLARIERAAKQKDAVWQRAIKQGLRTYLMNGSCPPRMLADIEYVARTLLTRGAGNKMLLEQAALTLPTRS